MAAKRSDTDWVALIYVVVGYIAGGLAAAAVFIGSWFYCVTEYGFLIGVSLGWFPAGILAGLTYPLVRYLWPLGVFAIVWAYDL